MAMRYASALLRFKDRRYLATTPSADDGDEELPNDDIETNRREKPSSDRSTSSTRLQRKSSFAPQLLAQDVDSKVNLFLDFIDKADEIRYRESVNRLSSRLTIPFIVLVASIGFARGIYFVLSNGEDLSLSGALIVSLIILAASILIFVAVIFAQIIMVYLPYPKGSYLYRVAEYVIYDSFGGGIQDVLQILSALGPGLALTAMVVHNNGIVDDTSMATDDLHQEQIFLTLFLPVCAQILSKGVRKSVAFVSWLISMAFVAGCIFYVRKWVYLWDLVFGLIFLSMMYEHEKSLRSYFSRLDMALRMDQRALKSSRKKVEFLQEERMRQQQELAHAEMKRERAIAEMQRDQFRRVIGQVALDLKTPLQAIFMDLDTLTEIAKRDGVDSTSNNVSLKRGESERIVLHAIGTGLGGGGVGGAMLLSPISASTRHNSGQILLHDGNVHSHGHDSGHSGQLVARHPHGQSLPGILHSASSSATSAPLGTMTTSSSAAAALRSFAREKRRISVSAHGSLTPSGGSRRGFDSLSKRPSRSDDMTLADVVTSLTASCNFLHMTVNRSMDFTKASSNIALVPSLAPFHLLTALTWPVTCMTQLQNASVVSLVPPSADISATVISDKHWIGENLLCLLVAAVKNGHGAPIIVRVVVTTPESQATIAPHTAAAAAASALVPLVSSHSSSSPPTDGDSPSSSASAAVGSSLLTATLQNGATVGGREAAGESELTTEDSSGSLVAALRKSFRGASGRIKLLGSGGDDATAGGTTGKSGGSFRVSSFRMGLGALKRDNSVRKGGGSFRMGGFMNGDASFRAKARETSFRMLSGGAGIGGAGTPATKSAEVSVRQTSFRRIASIFKGGEAAGDEAKDSVAGALISAGAGEREQQGPYRRAPSSRGKGKNRGFGSSSRTLLAPGSMIKIIVEDAGLGMSEQEKAEFFSDICAIRESVGVPTGDMPAKLGRSLGPYIVQKRVEALGGECGVSNRADGLNGTLYWFTFPYKPAASSSTVITSHNATSANGAASQSVSTLNAVKEGGGDDVDDHAAKRRRFTAQLNILLVDDSMTTLKVVRRTLMEQGHYVQTAKDGKQGLDSMLEAIQAVCMARSRDVSQLLSECSDEDLDDELKRLGSQQLLTMKDDDALLSLDPGTRKPQNQLQPLNFDMSSAKRSVTVLPPIGGSSTNNSPMKSGDTQQQVPSAAATDSADRYLLRGRRVSTVPMMLPPENLSALSRMSSSSTRSSISMSCFDVVLMDLEMPIMSGVAAVKSLRQYEKDHRQTISRYSQLSGSRGPLVIVGISANSDSDSRLVAKESGMDYFLAKPFSLADFQALLDEIYDDFSEYRDYGEDVTIAPSAIFRQTLPFDAALSAKLANLEDDSSSSSCSGSRSGSRSGSACSRDRADSPGKQAPFVTPEIALNALNSSRSSFSESKPLPTMMSRRNSRGEEVDD